MNIYRWKPGRDESPVHGIEPRDYDEAELRSALGECSTWGGDVERMLQYVSQFFDIEPGDDAAADDDSTPYGDEE